MYRSGIQYCQCSILLHTGCILMHLQKNMNFSTSSAKNHFKIGKKGLIQIDSFLYMYQVSNTAIAAYCCIFAVYSSNIHEKILSLLIFWLDPNFGFWILYWPRRSGQQELCCVVACCYIFAAYSSGMHKEVHFHCSLTKFTDLNQIFGTWMLNWAERRGPMKKKAPLCILLHICSILIEYVTNRFSFFIPSPICS